MREKRKAREPGGKIDFYRRQVGIGRIKVERIARELFVFLEYLIAMYI